MCTRKYLLAKAICCNISGEVAAFNSNIGVAYKKIVFKFKDYDAQISPNKQRHRLFDTRLILKCDKFERFS